MACTPALPCRRESLPSRSGWCDHDVPTTASRPRCMAARLGVEGIDVRAARWRGRALPVDGRRCRTSTSCPTIRSAEAQAPAARHRASTRSTTVRRGRSDRRRSAPIGPAGAARRSQACSVCSWRSPGRVACGAALVLRWRRSRLADARVSVWRGGGQLGVLDAAEARRPLLRSSTATSSSSAPSVRSGPARAPTAELRARRRGRARRCVRVLAAARRSPRRRRRARCSASRRRRCRRRGCGTAGRRPPSPPTSATRISTSIGFISWVKIWPRIWA